MYCLANICYVCLEKKSKLISNINSSLSLNKDIIHILDYISFNLAWLKTLQIILICEECCLRLRETYQFLEKCLKNGALLQSYRDKLSTTPISNTEAVAELLVKLNITHEDMNEVKCEIQSEDEEIYTFQWQPNIEEIGDVFVDFEDSLIKEGIICKKEVDDKPDNNSTEIIEQTEDVFVNLEDYFVKKENTWKQEEVDDTEESPTDNNSFDNMDTELDSEISVSDNAHLTNTDSVRSGFTSKQAHATNTNDLNTAAKKSFKCSTCSKSFIAKSTLNLHSRIHTDGKSYECALCKRRCSNKAELVRHMRTHTGEKPYECSQCKKCFARQSHLVRHRRIHTGEKSHECSTCKKCFSEHVRLMAHMRIHTGEKPYSCLICKKYFNWKSNLVTHTRIHTGDKPHKCSNCERCFAHRSTLRAHLRVHTGEKPYECSACKKCFGRRTDLVRHGRTHTGGKPQE